MIAPRGTAERVACVSLRLADGLLFSEAVSPEDGALGLLVAEPLRCNWGALPVDVRRPAPLPRLPLCPRAHTREVGGPRAPGALLSPTSRGPPGGASHRTASSASCTKTA